MSSSSSSHVLLGLFDGYMSHRRDQLTSETKIGGTATYFPKLTDTDATTVQRWTSCGVCGKPMSLLLQAFSPLPSALATQPHHRMVYVFACNSSYCARQPLSSMVAFSVQVDQEDTAALDEDEEEENEDEVIETGPLLPSELPPAVLPPGYVYIDDEPLKEVIEPTDVERELIKMAEENAKSTMTDAELQQLEQQVDLKDKRTDYLYEKFRARVARAPNQVLRYYPRPAASAKTPAVPRPKDAKPIFMNPEKVKTMVTIPACASCGAAQTAELQVMPTTLYYLQVAQYTAVARGALPSSTSTAADVKATPGNVDDGCDFGTITVYVCSKDCAARQSGVVLRKETLCVEEAPTMRDEERAEKAAAAASGDEPQRKTLMELLHGGDDDNDGEKDESDDEEGEEETKA